MPGSRTTKRSKRKYSAIGDGGTRKRSRYVKPNMVVSRPLPVGRAMIPITYTWDFDLTVDRALGFAFDTSAIYVNGGSYVPAQLTQLANVFDMMRVAKVEFSVIPAANSLDYNNQTLSTGSTNIPVIYHAFDANDGTAPVLADIQANPYCHTSLFDRIVKSTIYPRLEGANGVIDVGTNARNQFMKSGTTSTQRWNGWKMYLDMKSQVWTYGSGSVTMKIYYECMGSK